MGKLHQRWTIADYDRAADEYLQSLPLEHFMEAIPQSTQRELTLERLAVLRARRPDAQVFNELLVQYFHEGRLRQVVPDNMVRLSKVPTVTKTSFITEHEQVQPFLVIEYVSPNSEGKDYVDSFHKYEQELKVPYCLMFYPSKQDLRLHRHTGVGYQRVTPNAHGRLTISELDLEVALVDAWARYWHRGELLPLPAELLQQLDQERQRADHEKDLRLAAEAEVARLQGLLEQESTGFGKRKQ